MRNLPFKVETNRLGQLILTRATSRHGEYQAHIGIKLGEMLPHGQPIMSCPVQTTAGVRVPDVAWSSPARLDPVIFTLAPEICVEVLSPYNDEEEMAEKRALYFEAGALECWLCDEDGKMKFFGLDGPLPAGSALCPKFPSRMKLP